MVASLASKTELEDEVAFGVRALGLPAPEREYRFSPHRRFRFDFAWPAVKVALEVDGGTWIGGRHTSGAGYQRDVEKMNLAALTGWLVVRATKDMVKDGTAVNTALAALIVRGGVNG